MPQKVKRYSNAVCAKITFSLYCQQSEIDIKSVTCPWSLKKSKVVLQLRRVQLLLVFHGFDQYVFTCFFTI